MVMLKARVLVFSAAAAAAAAMISRICTMPHWCNLWHFLVMLPYWRQWRRGLSPPLSSVTLWNVSMIRLSQAFSSMLHNMHKPGMRMSSNAELSSSQKRGHCRPEKESPDWCINVPPGKFCFRLRRDLGFIRYISLYRHEFLLGFERTAGT